nr:sialin-like [Cherax quadricarinatus]
MSEKNDQVANSTLVLLQHHNLPRPKELWGCRHTLALLGFLGLSLVYAMRVNLSVAIVAMVKENNTAHYNNTSDNDGCPVPDDYDDNDSGNYVKLIRRMGEFDWDDSTRGLILASFFYGYTLTNFVGGRMAEYLGGKIVFGTGIFLTAILTLLSPVCARASTTLFIIIRILEGFTEGVTFPAMNFMLASWVPQAERPKFSTLVYTGVEFGTVATMAATGWLCDSDFMGGWPSVFYIIGVLGVVWSIAWFLLVFNHPQLHPRISEEEREYILHYCGKKPEKFQNKSNWKEIFKITVVTELIFEGLNKILNILQHSSTFFNILQQLPNSYRQTELS